MLNVDFNCQFSTLTWKQTTSLSEKDITSMNQQAIMSNTQGTSLSKQRLARELINIRFVFMLGHI